LIYTTSDLIYYNTMKPLTQERLKEILEYNPETGIFKRFKSRKGEPHTYNPENLNPYNYIIIRIDEHCYRAHRLAWLYVYGKLPEKQLDHINGIRNDNRIINLREATNSQNSMNKPNRKDNTSGHKGVKFNKKTNKWEANIKVNQKQTYLGLFVNKEDAIKAYQKAASLLHGEFAYKPL